MSGYIYGSIQAVLCLPVLQYRAKYPLVHQFTQPHYHRPNKCRISGIFIPLHGLTNDAFICIDECRMSDSPQAGHLQWKGIEFIFILTFSLVCLLLLFAISFRILQLLAVIAILTIWCATGSRKQDLI